MMTPDMSKPPQTRIADWLASRDTGASSMALAAVLLGGTPSPRANYPHDPDDIGRCFRLLRLIPEWRPRIAEMKACGPMWTALVERWDEIELSMESEVGIDWSKGQRARDTYALMRDVLAPAEEAERAASRISHP